VALALDASTPALVSGTTNPATTATFSPPANSMLFALCIADSNNTFSVAGGGLTWTQCGISSGGNGSVATFWAWNPSAQTNITVVSTRTGSFTANALKVLVFTGTELTTWTGADSANNTFAASASITTTGSNSWVWAIYQENSGVTSETPVAGAAWNDGEIAFGGISGGVLKMSAVTPGSGTNVTIGVTSASTPAIHAFEVKEAGAPTAFPTIPTQAAGTLAFVNQLNTTATLTGPNLNTLTKSPGDLLIAIAGEYQSNAGTDAAYTGWAGGGLTWTEIRDSSGTAVNRLGVAYARVVTGSETGTVTVTRSGTLVGDASMIVLVISGAHDTTAPEATVMATAANATPGAAPATLTPSWGAEDTLWVGTNGSGMTSATGSWTANNGAPASYTNYLGTAPADTSTIGDFGLAVAFRQLNAASETMAGFDVDASNNRTSALLIAVRPASAPPSIPNPNLRRHRPSFRR
jgi:hypothetical protein